MNYKLFNSFLNAIPKSYAKHIPMKDIRLIDYSSNYISITTYKDVYFCIFDKDYKVISFNHYSLCDFYDKYDFYDKNRGKL